MGVAFGLVGILLMGQESRTPGLILIGFVGVPAALVVLHELIHALAAKLLGLRVYEIRFGWREPWRRLRLGRLRIGIASDFWMRGFCIVGGERTPLDAAIVTASPMLVHLALALVALPFALQSGTLAVIARFLVLWNALHFYWSARPATYGERQSDGLQLRRLRKDRAAYMAEVNRAAKLLPALYALHDGDVPRALERMEGVNGDASARAFYGHLLVADAQYARALAFLDDFAAAETVEDPQEQRLRACLGELWGERQRASTEGSLYLLLGRREEALQLYERTLEAETMPEARPLWLADIAFAVLLAPNSPEERRRAYEAAREAFAHLPWVPHVRLAMALAHLEMGELDPVPALLTRMPGYEPYAKALRILQLAAQGELDEARRQWDAPTREATRFPDLRTKVDRAVGAHSQ